MLEKEIETDIEISLIVYHLSLKASLIVLMYSYFLSYVPATRQSLDSLLGHRTNNEVNLDQRQETFRASHHTSSIIIRLAVDRD